MSTASRSLHERAQGLAAALVDFDLARGEVEELEAHLDACPACRRDAVALRADTSRFSFAVVPALPSPRVDRAVSAEIAGRRKPFQGSFVLVAATALLVAFMGLAAAGATLLGIWPPTTDEPVPPPPGPVVTPPAPSPVVTTPRPDAGWAAMPGSLPAGSGTVQMAPGPAGGLYVVVNEPDGAVVALLDAVGEPRPGWPTSLPGWTCSAPGTAASWAPGVAPDGSIRLVCHDTGTAGEGATAFAFDAAGRSRPGWPVALGGAVAASPRVVDDRLVVVATEVRDDEQTFSDEDGYVAPGAHRLVTVDADGTVRTGVPIEVDDATGGLVSIGPDGTAFRVHGGEITAFDLGGPRAGWPVWIGGTLSAIGFGSDGRAWLTTSPDGTTTRLVVLDRDGGRQDVGPAELRLGGVPAYAGAGPYGVPLAPLVAGDGTVYMIGEEGGATVVYGIDPSGAVMGGWPYRAEAAIAWQGTCPEDSTGCGLWRAVPSVGPHGVLYVPLAGVDETAGGDLVAVGRDGQVVQGWPVGLRRAGAEWWSVVAASDETVYALAVEPERGGRTSATVLDIALDSSPRYRTTVVGPGGN